MAMEKHSARERRRLNVPDQFSPAFMAEVEKVYPEYFADLPPLK